jgi:DNA-binding transcriptional regulator YiaG
MFASSPLASSRARPLAVHRSILHAISMAATALTQAWSRGVRHSPAEMERLRTEVGLLREELDLKDARFARVPARRRPHYGPVQRMRILELRAARGWSARQVAERFLVSEETIANWMRRLDEEGEAGLVRLEEPVNRRKGR